MEEYGLYIHFPFCIQKCYYCDFNSVAWQDDLAAEFFTALCEEIKLVAADYDYPQLKSIFLGGGTPSCFSGQTIAELLSVLEDEFRLKTELEVTIEANPGTVDQNKLEIFKEVGINRLSFGVQSFDNRILNKLGRIHTAQKAEKNYYLAREVGFANINLDLIFAIPGQKLSQWKVTLESALQLAPEHLATYNLKIEPGTKLGKDLAQGRIEPVCQDLDLEMYQLTKKLLIDNGYEHYEISNFAKPGYRSEHNQIYWQNEPYLALGPGAHFYDGEFRGNNLESIGEYINVIKDGEKPVEIEESLSREDKIIETMILGLRLKEGISTLEFEERFGESVHNIYNEELKKLNKQGLIEINSQQIALTEKGRVLANDVLAEFIL
ncbi:radical SAM family heme chaperone HemW [Acetohalobium arabaticum]|uniref:Heme chaperone HemW n=1 Tax=Acetohalobium arabaticum (strain ATCC 49924 / DSM 5501 / Z-7288) TaxID=574087 RepID=D9QV84_ACEAZ|nr:radical SAM family heme chaperone HemW [Acetohalobium arabaticum]ADL12143.1 oxygen-independent coproporphyrinogen III oxidase [Acetohalobium arabaticum DSM 5501]